MSIVFAAISLEICAFILIVWAFVFFDEEISAWEHRVWRRVKRAGRGAARGILRRLVGLEDRFSRRSRKIRRELCVRLLAKDGVTIPPCQASQWDLDETFTEVMRLLNE